jgi:aconitate hydratase
MVVKLDLGDVTPSLAGPKRPQDRIEIGNVASTVQVAVLEADCRERLQPAGRALQHAPPGAAARTKAGWTPCRPHRRHPPVPHGGP